MAKSCVCRLLKNSIMSGVDSPSFLCPIALCALPLCCVSKHVIVTLSLRLSFSPEVLVLPILIQLLMMFAHVCLPLQPLEASQPCHSWTICSLSLHASPYRCLPIESSAGRMNRMVLQAANRSFAITRGDKPFPEAYLPAHWGLSAAATWSVSPSIWSGPDHPC